MGRLNDLGVKYRTDKSSICHTYLDFYESIFDKELFHYGDNVRLCEIGVLGGASIKMWRDYFGQKSEITGVDISDMPPIDGVRLLTMNAYDIDGLNIIKGLKPQILIDDGSHRSEDIIKLVKFLTKDENIASFPDIFIYEDCHAAFWEEYTPVGQQNSYYFCLDLFTKLDYKIMVKKRFNDFSDSVTMVITRK